MLRFWWMLLFLVCVFCSCCLGVMTDSEVRPASREVTIEASDSDDDCLFIKKSDFEIWERNTEMNRSMAVIVFDPETE